ncbi:hypothetical protein [Bradyrhizobium prioriisuperbiae]|uniref:hypothetical protein n=1 Tax=Bradyrhizobium prioriisuperbiae TaxID=2854389 RepID=UPI0028ED486E|nr:hypothetical protein [Bradyrhizobium prioritasuperba]
MAEAAILIPRLPDPDDAGVLKPSPEWPLWRHDELRLNTRNGRVGGFLASESERARVWNIWLLPGERLPFHRHVLDYFWTTTSAGRGRSHFWDGRVVESDYKLGDTRHFRVEKDGWFIHDLENIGDRPLGFVAVEFLNSANIPLVLRD